MHTTMRGRLGGLGWTALAWLTTALACGAEAPQVAEPVPAPPEPPPAAAEPKPEAETETGPPDVAASRCAQDLAAERPVALGEVGQGRRMVRVINNGSVELRVRLVNTQGEPALPGTLRVPAAATGTFKVDAGSYIVRYRVETTCQVFEGSPVHLTGPRSGVEIGLKPLFEKGSAHDVRPVDGDL